MNNDSRYQRSAAIMLDMPYQEVERRYGHSLDRMEETYRLRLEAMREHVEARDAIAGYFDAIWPGDLRDDADCPTAMTANTSAKEAMAEFEAAVRDFEKSDLRLRRARKIYLASMESE